MKLSTVKKAAKFVLNNTDCQFDTLVKMYDLPRKDCIPFPDRESLNNNYPYVILGPSPDGDYKIDEMYYAHAAARQRNIAIGRYARCTTSGKIGRVKEILITRQFLGKYIKVKFDEREALLSNVECL